MMKKMIIYISILVAGVVMGVLAVFLNDIARTIFLSLGTGLIASALTAGVIDLSNFIDFGKKRSYRRKIELNHLSFEMFLLAQLITGEHTTKDINTLIIKLSEFDIKEDNTDYVLSYIDSKRNGILKELNTIRDIQNYLSLSGYFTDQEIAFLCRSINYYSQTPSKENVKAVIRNIVSYLEMFIDTL